VPKQVSQQWYEEARELVARANGHHSEAGNHQRLALFHAKEAGEALIKAKDKVPYKRWGGFLRKEFYGSGENARNYMRIARNWDDPRIQEARLGKMTPPSIDGLLAIIRNRPDKAKQKPTKSKRASFSRQFILDRFAKYLNKLEPEELEVLSRGFRGAMAKLYKWLTEMAFIEYEDDAAFISETYRRQIQRMEDAKKSRNRGRQRIP
jgi:hypothetical protein